MRKYCLLHSAPAKNYLKNILASLRRDQFTTRNLHDFIIYYLCKCGAKSEIVLDNKICLDEIDNQLLPWIDDLNEESIFTRKANLKPLLKVKQELKSVYEIIKDNTSKRYDCLQLFKFFKICSIYLKIDKIMVKFLNLKIDGLDFNSNDNYVLNVKLELSRACLGQLIGRSGRNLTDIQTLYNCRIKIEPCGLNKLNAKVWADSYVDFFKIKNLLRDKCLSIIDSNKEFEERRNKWKSIDEIINEELESDELFDIKGLNTMTFSRKYRK